MVAKLISGTEIAAQIKGELRERIEVLKARGTIPGLAVILVGEDPASQSYVRMKEKMCEELGLYSRTIKLPAATSEEELLGIVDALNRNDKIDGILVQSPLPAHIDEMKVIELIDPGKDVDGFHPVNVGKMLIGNPGFLPCTPHGVQELLMRSGNDPEGKRVVIVGRSNIVGKPLAALLMQKSKGANATVTVCHSRTRDLQKITREADILIAAIGSPHFIKKDMIKEGTVVIDVGSNRIEDSSSKRGYRFVGDVDFDQVKELASAITPETGGVGPMTIIMLMQNTVISAEQRMKRIGIL